jgi:hypothetical protein
MQATGLSANKAGNVEQNLPGFEVVDGILNDDWPEFFNTIIHCSMFSVHHPKKDFFTSFRLS